MRRVLVTAALGNVGREVVDRCVRQGLAVRVTDRDPSRMPAAWRSHEPHRLDFLDRSTWAPALDGCDGVFLLRPPPIGDMRATLCPFIDAAYRRGVQHLVFLSVAGAERNEWVPHRKVERHLEAHAGSWTVLRPGFFAQNLRDAYRRDIVEDDRLHVPAARGRVAFIDVRDLAEVAARVFLDPGAYRRKALTITGGEAVTFDEVARLLSVALQRPIRYEPASVLGYVWHLRRRRSLPWMQAVIQTILHVGLRRGDAEAVDPTLAAILGRRPRTMAAYIADDASTWRTPPGRAAASR